MHDVGGHASRFDTGLPQTNAPRITGETGGNRFEGVFVESGLHFRFGFKQIPVFAEDSTINGLAGDLDAFGVVAFKKKLSSRLDILSNNVRAVTECQQKQCREKDPLN